jgi:hypothetical protein
MDLKNDKIFKKNNLLNFDESYSFNSNIKNNNSLQITNKNLKNVQDNISSLTNSNSLSENILHDNFTLAVEKKNLKQISDCKNNINDDKTLINDRENSDSEISKVNLKISRFPYLENTNVETILSTSIATNIESESVLQDNSALTLLNVQDNLSLLADGDEFFFIQHNDNY